MLSRLQDTQFKANADIYRNSLKVEGQMSLSGSQASLVHRPTTSVKSAQPRFCNTLPDEKWEKQNRNLQLIKDY